MQHANESARVEGFYSRIYLSVGKSSGKVLGDLHRGFGKNSSLHAARGSFLVEKVLGLGEAEFTEHAETVRSKVYGNLRRLQGAHLALQLVKNPPSLHEHL